MEKRIRKIENKCDHVWFLDGHPTKPTGKYAFLGRTLICKKCKLRIDEKTAGDSEKFKFEMKRLGLS